MKSSWFRRVLRPAVLTGVLSLVACSAAGAAGIRWSKPVPLAYGVESIACPSTSLCVLGTVEGVYVSTHPSGGATAWIASVKPPHPRGYSAEVHGVACPSAKLCVADGPHAIMTSRNPAGGAAAWKVVRLSLPGSDDLAGVACQTTRVCVAIVTSTKFYPSGKAPHGGLILVSSDPTGGAAAWRRVKLHDVPDAVSCVHSFCMLATDDGDILHTRHPTGRANTWRGPHLLGARGQGGNDEMPALACASTRYCLAPLGNITGRGELRTRDPLTRRLGPWAFGQYLGGANRAEPLSASCTVHAVCAVSAFIAGSLHHGYSEVMTSSGYGRRWDVKKFTDATVGAVVSCVSAHFCVAGGGAYARNYSLTGIVSVGR